MVCPNCGKRLAARSRYCPYCSSSLCPHCGSQIAPRSQFCPHCNGSLALPQTQDGTGVAARTAGNPLDDPRGMKWFKFIIYVDLFLTAAFNVTNAFRLFSGTRYDGKADLVYAVFPSLKPVDIFVGILSLGFAVFAIFVRQRLASFSYDGPKLYYTFVIASAAVSILYLILVSSATGLSFGNVAGSGTIANLIVNVVMLVINKIYFDKRADLFRN